MKGMVNKYCENVFIIKKGVDLYRLLLVLEVQNIFNYAN